MISDVMATMFKVSAYGCRDASNANLTTSVGSTTLTTGAPTTQVSGGGMLCGTNSYCNVTSAVNNPATNATWELCLNLTATTDTQYLFKQDGTADTLYMRFQSGDATNLWCNDSVRTITYARASIATGKKITIGLTSNATTSVIYYNGVAVTTVTSGGARGSSSSSFNMNGYDTAAGNNIKGTVYNASVSNMTWNVAQMKNNYLAQVGFN